MEDIIREANEIVEEVAKTDRKENAFRIILMSILFAGLAMCSAEKGSRVEAVDSIFKAMKDSLAEQGYRVSGENREFEAKFKMMQLQTVFEHEENMEASVHETFDQHVWNVCLFDGAVAE